MAIYYAADRTPPAARLVAFTERQARDGYVKVDADHREAVRAALAAQLCKTWHGMGLAEALAKGVI
jgi:hypothetical protein